MSRGLGDVYKRQVQLNGYDYEAKVHITYTDHTTSDGKTYDTGYDSNTVTKDTNEAITSEFNDYEIPNPNRIYGKESVVAKEEDQLDRAISYFLTNEATDSNTFFTKYNLIKDKLDRRLAIHLEYKDGDPDIYKVKVSYLYELNGANISPNIENGVYEAPLEISEVKRESLKNIYVFYNLRSGYDNDRVKVTFGTGISEEDIKNIHYYLCGLTTTECPDRVNNYKFLLSTDSDPLALKCNYFFNGNTDTILTAKEDDGSTADFISKKTKKRIGAIEVSVYEKGSNEPLAVMNTTISE